MPTAPGWSGLFPRHRSLDRQGMDPLAGDVAQRTYHHALALKPRNTAECGAFDHYGKVRFVGAIVPGVAAVAGAVVDHLQPGGGERLGQQAGDFLCDGSGHGFSIGRGIAMCHPMNRQSARHDRFHGRHSAPGRACDWPECGEHGEFRAPGHQPSGFDGPGSYRWFCLDHVRAFNAGYDYFDGMTAEQILEAQSPIHGWAATSRAFTPTAGIDGAPRWADFADPLEAISRRAQVRAAVHRPAQRQDGKPVTPDERRALELLELALDATRHDLRARYSELVRRYHPDRNGGDRSMEHKLQQVIENYQLLRRSVAFR